MNKIIRVQQPRNAPLNLTLATRPIKCTVNLCHCDTDVSINKRIDNVL